MPGYLAKRLVYGVTVLLAVSFLTFFLRTLAPGDQVEAHLSLDGGGKGYQRTAYAIRAQEYARGAARIGLDLPVFYFTVAPRVLPDTLFSILHKEERRAQKDLALQYGDWTSVQSYRSAVLQYISHAENMTSAGVSDAAAAAGEAEFLLSTSDTGRITYLLASLRTKTQALPELLPDFAAMTTSYETLQQNKVSFGDILPSLRWHGFQNQYHVWISGILHGEFGRSLIDGRAVSVKIGEALRWTLRINISAILLAFGLAIPLGLYTARRAGGFPDRLISGVLFTFYAMPAFWLGMLCIVFLTTPEYGKWLDWFPTGGVGMTHGKGIATQFFTRIHHLTLPVLCILLGSLAYLTRQMRGSILREIRQDYIRLARAKGLSEKQVFRRHALRNALFPMITLIGSAFPAAISGSVILEVIFSIPGMGRLLYMSIIAQDWPVVYAMVLFGAGLTVIGYLVADLLYRWADPRVDFTMQRT